MPRHDDDFENPRDYERYDLSSLEEERDAPRQYSRGGQSERRRDFTPERRGGRSPRRQTEYGSSRKGKEEESSPLKFNPNYWDDPVKHRYRSPDGSRRHEIAEKRVYGGCDRTWDPSGDNQSARRDREGARVASKDFAEGGGKARSEFERSASERKYDESRDKGKGRRH